MDELIRHHPSLKLPVFDAVKAVFSKIEDLGNAFVIPEDKEEWYGLLPVQPSEEIAAPMQGIESEGKDSEFGSGLASDTHDEPSGEDTVTQRDHDNNVVMFIDVICRVSTAVLQWRDFAHSPPLVPRRAFPTSPTLQGFHPQRRWLRSDWEAYWSSMPPVRLR